MTERRNIVTMGGNPVTLLGNELEVGDLAPHFTVVDNELGEKELEDFAGKVRLISVVTSLDTGVCDLQAKRFNEEATTMGEDVVILTVSMDLPFAQKRWCAASGIDKVHTLSDHRDASFGIGYGVLMKESRLLARSIFVVDQKGKIRYIEIVKEIAQHPNYEKALAAVKKLL